MKRLDIESEFARIGIKTQPAKLNIKSNPRPVRGRANIQQPAKSRPTFTVNVQSMPDQTGTAGVVALSRRFALSQAAGIDGADQGDVNAAAGGVVEQPALVEWDTGSTRINMSDYELNIEWDNEYLPDISVEPHSVEIFMENYPSIKISVVDNGLLISHGRNVDRKV